MKRGFVILDFGSQYTQLIARKFRELGYFSEILAFDASISKIREKNPAGIILSGGPSSVHAPHAPLRSVKELSGISPILGICYGMQLVAQEFGAQVKGLNRGEYGAQTIQWSSPITSHSTTQNVWMSHGDEVLSLPNGFTELARSHSGILSAMKNERILCLQFHPEVQHTEYGTDILEYFAHSMCDAEKNWNSEFILEHTLDELKKKVPAGEHVLCALSGGVDSTVMGTLLTHALGADRVHCVFINNGLLRKNEFEEVKEIYKSLGLNLLAYDASQRFLDALKGVVDPEAKRKIIGRTFIEIFEELTQKFDQKIQWLGQGTLYPDVIESVSLRGTSVTIKSHHNVGGLPEKMNLKLVEPLRELFKDEVRKIGSNLNIDSKVLSRHPFPGPGLSVRLLGEVTESDLYILRECDHIYIQALKEEGLYDQIWQAFCVLLPIRSVGVQGDGRSYGRVLALRAVTSKDGMTADWFEFPQGFLKKVSNRITNQVREVNRVVYDITSKPPGTIEWE